MNLYTDTDPAAGEETAVQQWIQDGYSMLWMEEEDYRCDSEVEADSDHEDHEETLEHHGGWLGNNLVHFHMDLDSSETGTVRRRAKTIVTPKMAMESFRLSFLNDDQDVNFDAILGELSELETQLNSTQSELSQTLGRGGPGHLPQCVPLDGRVEGGSDVIQAELDALAAEITQGLSYRKTNGQLLTPVHPEHMGDTGETDSAFSDNTSLPSSESFTSMATVSSSAETTSSSSGETCSMNSAVSTLTMHGEEEHLARLKAEKIRIALEKIKEAKIRKLFVRAFAKDGSSKSILVDEKMTVSQVCSVLADKHHGRLTHDMAVIEHMPELFMERILEDHDSLVENMVMWTRDSRNKVLFEERREKYNLFFHPEKYLLPGTSSQRGTELASSQRERLIQEFFSPAGVSVPEVEGALFLKSDGKKAWKKYFFVLRASGLYYNPKGKVSKAPKDLVCLVQFEYVEVYWGLGWKKKYHSPTDFCFALKHPQIQKKTSKYIRYFCAETQTSLDQWIMGIRIAKLGKQLLHNFERVHHEVATWDLRQATTIADGSDLSTGGEGLEHCSDHFQGLNQTSLQDSRLSVLTPSSHHTIVTVHSTTPGRTVGSGIYHGSEVIGAGVAPVPHRKEPEGSGDGSTGHKTPTKRVSFSTTHCIITDSSEQLVVAKHRDSIVSASTDSSEDSSSSGENRHTMANTLRGKLRPKLPVTTETTRLLTEMNQLSFDSGTSPSGDGGSFDEISSLSSGSSTLSRHTFSRSDRRRSSMSDRRGSTDSNSRTTHHHRMNGNSAPPMSPPATMGRRHSHEGSPGRMSPLMRHSGTQQWVDDVQYGMESVPDGSRSAQDPYAGPDRYMYAGGMSVYQQQQYQYQQQQQQYQQQLQQYQEQYQLHKQFQQHQQQPSSQSQYQELQQQQSYYQELPTQYQDVLQQPQYQELREQDSKYPGLLQEQPSGHQEHHHQKHPSCQEYDINPHLYATIGQMGAAMHPTTPGALETATPPHYGEHMKPPEAPSLPLPHPLSGQLKQLQQQSKVGPPPTAPKPAPPPPIHPQQPPPPPPVFPQQAHQPPPAPTLPQQVALPLVHPQQVPPLPPVPSQQVPPPPMLPQVLPAFMHSQAPPPVPPQQVPPPPMLLQQISAPPMHPQPVPKPPPVPSQQVPHLPMLPQQVPPHPMHPQQAPPPVPPQVPAPPMHPQQAPPPVPPQQVPPPPVPPQKAPPLPPTVPPQQVHLTPLLQQQVLPPSTHPQQAPPPPVLPKTVPMPTEGTIYGTTGRHDIGRGHVTSPMVDGARTLPLTSSKPGPPPLKIPTPQAGKVGPPVLPKSSAASPMSPINVHGQYRAGQSGMSTSPMSPVCSSSAPSTLMKSGATSPAAYHSQGHMVSSADNYYEMVQQSSGSPNSPHRISHVKHPSTGSPMLGMGSSPTASQGPTPSDSGYIEGDSSSCAGSPSNLPYLVELSRRSQAPGLGTSPPKICAQVLETAGHGAASHRRSASAGSSIVKGGAKQDAGKRAPPPPPPKRSETTRLSTDVKPGKGETPPASPSTQMAEQGPPLAQGAIYENYEGIIDINDLPPPPPELLIGLAESSANPSAAAVHGNTAGQLTSSKKPQKLPPPPPKRSKDTQLSHH